MSTQTASVDTPGALSLIQLNNIRISRQNTHELLATAPNGIFETTLGDIQAYHCELEEGEELTPQDIVSITAAGIPPKRWMRLERIILHFLESPIYVFTPALAAADSTPSKEQSFSDLEPVLSDIPWNTAFAEGAGVDAVTGNIMGAVALNPFRTKSTTVLETEETLDSILDFSSVQQRMEASTKGNYNIEGVAINESTSYLSEIRQSALEITYAATYRANEMEYEAAPEGGYELTADALAMLRKQPEQFRTVYGDYFVASRKDGSSFRAVYTLKARSSNELTSFESSAGVSVEGLFSKEGSAKFQSDAAKFGIEVSVYVHMYGVQNIQNQPAVNYPSDIPAALAWFKQNQSPAPHTAKLIHYSALYPSYPRRIHILPQVFVELRTLYTRLWDIRVLYHSLPSFYTKQLSDTFIAVDSGISTNQSTLASDAKLRTHLQGQTNALWQQLMQIRSRQAFHDRVRSMSEPKQGDEQKENTSTNFWSYGMTASPDPENIRIHATSHRAHAHTPGYGSRTATLSFGPDPQFTVVGWEVSANWHDGTDGLWQKAAPRNLLSHYAAVSVKSKFDRGFDWTVTFYHVDAEPYSHFD